MQNYFTQNFLNRGFSRFSASLFLAATLAIVAGCGSGGAGNGSSGGTSTPGDTTPPVATAASIQLLASSPQMPSAGGTANTVDLTAIVLSATGQAVSDRTVTFSRGTDSAFFTDISAGGVSDDNGIVTSVLNLGSDKSNRTITISATADSATATNTVDVTGTTVTISGTSSLAFDATTTLTFTVKDSAGTALPNVTVSVASATGNTIALTPATGITNGSGQITADITAENAGNDTITATVAGASATQVLTISDASFAFTTPTLVAPATSIDIPLNTATTVSVNWKNAGVPQAGEGVTFATSRGTVVGSPATTNATGDTAGVTVSSSSAGTAIVTASGTGGTPAATLTVAFVATTASSVAVQAVPGTIQVTTGVASQTSNSSTISVLVRDAANNLVKNAGVDFKVTSDPSGGVLNSARAITDVNGSASVTYTAGTTSSPSNGVIIQASVTDINGAVIAPVTNTTTLTVAGQSLLVRLGTDNLVEGAAPVNNKTYVAIVTDSAGNAVVGTTVRFALRPGQYSKGFYTFIAEPINQWVQTVTVTCPNEDLNFNGILDTPPTVAVSEDNNGNNTLDPGNVATVTATATTNASGVATATITYAKDHATWVEDILEARTGVVGNDPPALVTFVLPGLGSDYTTQSVAPPGVISPYGQGAVCNNTD